MLELVPDPPRGRVGVGGQQGDALGARQVGAVDPGVRAHPARLRLDDQRRRGSADDAARFREDQLDQAGVAARLGAEPPGLFAGRDGRQLDYAPLGLRDDLLRDRDQVAVGQRRAGGDRGGGDQFADPIACGHLGQRLERTDLQSPAHPAGSVAMGSRARAAAVDGARSGSLASRRARAATSSGVSRSSAREGSASVAASWPARWARSRWRAQLDRTPARSRRRGRGGAHWCRCRGGPG